MELSKRINELKNNFNQLQNKKEFLVRTANSAVWNMLTEEAKQTKLTEYSKSLRDEYRNKLMDLKTDIQKERNLAAVKIQRIKFPELVSKDSSERLAGESQKSQALSFLSTPKNSQQILDELKSAIALNRFTFAFTVIDSILNTQPENVTTPLSDKQKYLIEEVKNIYNQLGIKSEIDKATNEMKEVQTLDSVITSFDEQLQTGKEYLISAELTPYMSELEKAEMIQQTEQLPFIESIATKRRISELQGGIHAR